MAESMQVPPNSTENPRGFGGTPDPEPETDADGNELATPDEQMDYDFLVVRARKMIFGKGKEKILKMLGTSESPAKAIGQVGSMLVKSLMDSSKQAGKEIAGDVAIHAAAEIADDLNELAKANNVFQYDSPEDEEKELADAMLWGVKFYGDGMIANKEITPEMKQMAQKEVEEGLASEGSAPRQTPIAAGVGQAVNPTPGIVGGTAKGGY
jgi:hypothetical protein